MIDKSVLAVIFACGLTGCVFGDRYSSEVGWYEGRSERWDISGDYDSLDACRAAAIGQFNRINAESPGRAFSWACLKKASDGGYESRHR